MAKIPKSTSYDSVNTPPLLSSTWTRLDEQEGEELEGAGSDSEWEADEITSLTLDFGELSAQALEQHHSLQLLGEASSKPIARVGTQTFIGRYEQLIGDAIFLLEKEDRMAYESLDPGPLSTSRITFEPCSALTHQEAAQRAKRKAARSGKARPVKVGSASTGERAAVGGPRAARTSPSRRPTSLPPRLPAQRRKARRRLRK